LKIESLPGAAYPKARQISPLIMAVPEESVDYGFFDNQNIPEASALVTL